MYRARDTRLDRTVAVKVIHIVNDIPPVVRPVDEANGRFPLRADPNRSGDAMEKSCFIWRTEKMAVAVKTDLPQFEVGIPKVLFDGHLISSHRRNDYVVAPDGRQFLAVMPVERAALPAMTAVVNWTADLKR